MAHNKTQPLYMYLAFQSVHRPLQAPAMYTRLYDGQGLTGPQKVRFVKEFLKPGLGANLFSLLLKIPLFLNGKIMIIYTGYEILFVIFLLFADP